jgi:hypothetical protein
MKKNLAMRTTVALLIVWSGLFLLAGCAKSSSSSGGGGTVATECATYCSRIEECEQGPALDVPTTALCLGDCPSVAASFRNCVLAAANCADVAACIAERADDDASPADDDDDASPADDDATPPNNFQCSDLQMPVVPFIDVPDSTDLFATAADFTVNTTEGPWSLKENWTGCETYLIIQDDPAQNAGSPIGIWERDGAQFLQDLPPNVQVIFAVQSVSDPSAIAALLDKLQEQFAPYLASLSQADQDRWFHRLHYATQNAAEIPGWVGQVMLSPGWGIGIDRFQRIRYIGSYADPTRYDANTQWFDPNLSMAANEPIYYNYEATRKAAMDAEGATVVNIFNKTVISANGAPSTLTAEVNLPDAATMAGFDSVELDLTLDCIGAGEMGFCPAWDYIVNLQLCEPDDPTVCDVEFGRWITTYHRIGEWVHDVSGILPLIANGGTRTFTFYSQNAYYVTLNLRLFNAKKPDRPNAATFLFSGGTLGPDYNTQHSPITMTVPSGFGLADLAVVVTGHGGDQPGNCAEFCDIEHHFVVNGHDNVISFPDAGNTYGCMQAVDQGTVPNQYGTWWYGRDGWCPGKQVPMSMTDVTSQIIPDAENTFQYYAYYDGADYPNNGPMIDLSSWLVLSDQPQ